MLRQQLTDTLQSVLTSSASTLNLPDPVDAFSMLNIERPRQDGFGDFAVNVSPLARYAKLPPVKIAEIIAADSTLTPWQPTVTGGFINFKLPTTMLTESLLAAATAADPGQNTSLQGVSCLIEFVSANPTGPLHIGHGRWVALGDSLTRIMRHCGADVTREFYINDAGNQMFNIANTLWYRCLELLETGGKLPEKKDDAPYPFYPGEYTIEMAKGFLETGRQAILDWDLPEHIAPPEAIAALSQYAKTSMLAQQKELMAQCGLEFEAWFSETDLHGSGAVVQMLDMLKAKGVTYEQEGAVWFASSRFGDDMDRVLVKSDGSYTYLTADIAYHHQKFSRENNRYNLLINIWGADHHGYIPRMKAAMIALGHDPEKLEIILGQLVNLLIDGERTRMGKRKKMLTLTDLVDEVGVDAVRFWMVSKSHDTALDFNVELAQSASDENPVFYVQYAHARCASILRNAFIPRPDTLSETERPAILTEAGWSAFQQTLTLENPLATLFDSLENDSAPTALRELIIRLDSLTDKIIDSAKYRSPHILVRYALDLSSEFHRFYNTCRILSDDVALTQQRLVIITSVKQTLAKALSLIGVSAPDRM